MRRFEAAPTGTCILPSGTADREVARNRDDGRTCQSVLKSHSLGIPNREPCGSVLLEGTPKATAVGGLYGKDGRLAVLSQRAESGLGLGGIAVLSRKTRGLLDVWLRSWDIQDGEGWDRSRRLPGDLGRTAKGPSWSRRSPPKRVTEVRLDGKVAGLGYQAVSATPVVGVFLAEKDLASCPHT